MTSPAEQLDEPRVFPVGRYSGAMHDDPGGEDVQHWVRPGASPVTLTDVEARVWVLARALPGHPVGAAPRASELTAAARSRFAADGVVEGLVARGLLVELDTAPAARREFAAAHAVVTLSIGLGNTAREPAVFTLGLPGHPLVSVRRTVVDLVLRGHRHADLWAACQASAAEAVRLGSTRAEDRTPDGVLDQLLEALPTLLATDAVFLDRRSPR